jgi:hypothetical protein
LENIAKQNPAHQATIQYAGAFHLLTKNLDFFPEFLENHYDTAVLPELPKSFQEAVVIVWEQDPDYWERYNVSASVIQRFNELRRQVQANRNNTSTLPGLLKRNFGDTYWFYYMYK